MIALSHEGRLKSFPPDYRQLALIRYISRYGSYKREHRSDYSQGRRIGAALKAAGSDGIVYPSARHAGGDCVGLFYPDTAAAPMQGRHLDYHWNGERVDMYREPAGGTVFRIVAP